MSSRRVMSRAGGLVTLLAMSLLLAGCGGWGGAPRGAAGANPWQTTALWMEQDGVTAPFANGSTVAAGDLDVEVFLSPYPPVREGSIDLYVTDRAARAPVEGSGVRIVFDMYMPHGQIKAEAMPMGGGHYLVPYKLVMPGEWRVDLALTSARGEAALGLIFKVG